MADEKKAQQVSEKQATDAERVIHGRKANKSGYGYRYESFRNDQGKLETRKVTFKVGS